MQLPSLLLLGVFNFSCPEPIRRVSESGDGEREREREREK